MEKLMNTKEEGKHRNIITKEDLTKFQAELNQSLIKFEAGIKAEIMEMKKSIPILTDFIKNIYRNIRRS